MFLVLLIRVNVDGKVKIFRVNMLVKYQCRSVPDVGMVAQVADTVRVCVGVVSVDDAEVSSRIQVQTLPSQSVETVQVVHFGHQLSESQLRDLREVFVDF